MYFRQFLKELLTHINSHNLRAKCHLTCIDYFLYSFPTVFLPIALDFAGQLLVYEARLVTLSSTVVTRKRTWLERPAV